MNTSNEVQSFTSTNTDVCNCRKPTFIERIPELIIAAVLVVGIVGAFSLGLSLGQRMNTHEYRLILEDQDAQILLESVHEIIENTRQTN